MTRAEVAVFFRKMNEVLSERGAKPEDVIELAITTAFGVALGQGMDFGLVVREFNRLLNAAAEKRAKRGEVPP